jgi:hypothetical protein
MSVNWRLQSDNHEGAVQPLFGQRKLTMFFKLACTTLAFCIGQALIRQLVLFLLDRTQGAVGIRMSGPKFGILFCGYLLCVFWAGVANIFLYS